MLTWMIRRLRRDGQIFGLLVERMIWLPEALTLGQSYEEVATTIFRVDLSV